MEIEVLGSLNPSDVWLNWFYDSYFGKGSFGRVDFKVLAGLHIHQQVESWVWMSEQDQSWKYIFYLVSTMSDNLVK